MNTKHIQSLIALTFVFTAPSVFAAEKGKVKIIKDTDGGYALYLNDKPIGEARTLNLGNEIELAPAGESKRPGKAKFKNIVLKRGMINDNAFKQLLSVNQNDKDQFRIIVQSDKDEWQADLVEIKTARVNKEFSPAEEQLKGNPRHRTFKSSDTYIVEELEFAVERVER